MAARPNSFPSAEKNQKAAAARYLL